FELGDLPLHVFEALLARLIALLLQGLRFDLELHQPARDRVDLRGHAVDFDLDFRGGLVNEVDGLVGEEAIGHVAIAESRRRDERGVLDADAVVDLVSLLEAAEDRDGIGDGRLRDDHGLEAALERRVLLDSLPVLVERRRADAAELAPGGRRLEPVGGVHRTLPPAPAPTIVWSSSMKRMIRPADVSTSLRTALRRSSNSPRYLAPATRAPMSRAQSILFFNDSGTSPRTMRCAMPSTIAVLPTPGSPMSTGLFFVLRESTCITRRISSSRPMTGSIFPLRAASVRSRQYFSR